MIDIPLNKALVAVAAESGSGCFGCVFRWEEPCRPFACEAYSRKDGEDVVFKWVDLPKEE